MDARRPAAASAASRSVARAAPSAATSRSPWGPRVARRHGRGQREERLVGAACWPAARAACAARAPEASSRSARRPSRSVVIPTRGHLPARGSVQATIPRYGRRIARPGRRAPALPGRDGRAVLRRRARARRATRARRRHATSAAAVGEPPDLRHVLEDPRRRPRHPRPAGPAGGCLSASRSVVPRAGRDQRDLVDREAARSA